jgi:hypothetical protein
VTAAGTVPLVAGAEVSGVPHSPQNLPVAARAPQVGQVGAIDVPQSTQNFTPGRLAAPHAAQG